MKKERKKKTQQKVEQEAQQQIERPAPAPAPVRRPYITDKRPFSVLLVPGGGRWMMSFCEEHGMRAGQRHRRSMVFAPPLPGPPTELTCVQSMNDDGSFVLRLAKSEPGMDHALEHALPHER